MTDTRQALEALLAGCVEAQCRDGAVATRWRRPLVGVAAADDPLFVRLREVVRPSHALPAQLLPGAHSVVAFFLPFEPRIVSSNRHGGMASADWARAYVETNALIDALCARAVALLEARGEQARATPATHNFDPAELVSDWSHRHVAHVAGLGTLGLNNMLITARGCCGRLGSLVTTAALAPDPRSAEEGCLQRRGQRCGLCVARCESEALTADDFDRHRCHALLRENQRHHAALGRPEVCGKCLVKLPCSHRWPRAAPRGGG